MATTRKILWQGTYVKGVQTIDVRICEVTHDNTDPAFPDTPTVLVSRMVEMASTFDAMGEPIWTLTEFDADMLLFFLLQHPTTVQPFVGEVGTAATVAADQPASSAPVAP